MKPITVPKVKGPKGAAAVAASPRAVLIGSLTDAIKDASGTGDAGAVRVAMEALSRLLGGGERG